MAASVGVLAAMLRFVGLGYPTNLVFDEAFYARGAYSLAMLGFEGDWEGDNQDLAKGDASGLSTTQADYVVHPMMGKLLIAAGIKMFGATPYGWRFASAVVGTITVVLIALIARQLLQSTVWGTMAGMLLAVDGQHVVHSRTALLDIFLTFFVVIAAGFLVLDRASAHRTLKRKTSLVRESLGLPADGALPGAGPGLGIRWWRFAAILAFGLSVGVKWSGLYVAAAFLLLSVGWDLVDRRRAGYERWYWGGLSRAVPAGLLTLVTIPAVYLATWLPWFRAEQAYGRGWAARHPGEGLTSLPESLRSLAHYHEQMWDFHRGLDAEHRYEANPWGWIIQLRPTAFHFEDVEGVECGVERCVSAIHALGHPLIWWAGAAVLMFALWRVVRRRDMLALTISAGVLVSWVPWLFMAERTIFSFYTVVMAPFVVLLLAWVARRIAQPDRLEGEWSRRGVLLVTGYMAVVFIFAGFFLPIWTGQVIPFFYWQIHMWLPSWV